MTQIPPIRVLAGIAVLVQALAMTACTEKPQQPPHKPPLPKTESGDRLMKEQRDALEKAKGVGQTVEKAETERKEATEKVDQDYK